MCDIDRYANQCIRVERMFVELSSNTTMLEMDFNDIETIRCKYGVKEITTIMSHETISDQSKKDKQMCAKIMDEMMIERKVKDESENYKPVSKRLRNRAVKGKRIAPLEPLISVTIKEEHEDDTLSNYVRPPSVIDLNDNDQLPYSSSDDNDEELNIKQTILNTELPKFVSDASLSSSSDDSDDNYAKPTKKRQKKLPTEYIEYVFENFSEYACRY